MEKNEFIKSAPEFYEAAIILFFLNTKLEQTRHASLIGYYEYYDSNRLGHETAIGIKPLYDVALKNLTEKGIIKETKLRFGPSFIEPTEAFLLELDKLQNISGSAVQVMLSVGDSKQWMLETLLDIDNWHRKLGLNDSDFLEFDDAWLPISLDRGDANLENTISKFEDVVEQVRTSNGYAASHENERNNVYLRLENLLSVLKYSKETSRQYLEEYAIIPLKILISRFGGAIIGVTAAAAKEALKEYLKEKARNWLNIDLL